MAPVNGRPFLSYLLDQVAESGIRRTVICTGYKGDQVSRAFGSFYAGLSLEYSIEERLLGTGGALRLALPLTMSDPVLVMNGDSYLQTDLPGFFDRHRELGAENSILITRVEDRRRYGWVLTGPDGQVTGFVEKSQDDAPARVNAGIYLLSRKTIEALPRGQSLSLERDILPRCVGRRFFGIECGGGFLDIGTPESYRLATEFMLGTGKNKNKDLQHES
jgi:NDP-sugar pyrophosphorylase family protein